MFNTFKVCNDHVFVLMQLESYIGGFPYNGKGFCCFKGHIFVFSELLKQPKRIFKRMICLH